nr:hypothetical protein [Phycisphaerae bacterium]NIR62793.1 hypothetical protein [candidate division Zixibacteria bacterium]NIW43736.1 hypothetical protein [Gammaproteobacteria bacterium]NIU12956.1 hypothetical protein [candidate division Zixibacteria bacterium]NIV05020.1 hypothetical protein [candidate division Zixibacteria bacterium]
MKRHFIVLLAALACLLFSNAPARAEDNDTPTKPPQFTGTILISITDHNYKFVLPLPSEEVIRLKKAGAFITKDEFEKRFEDYYRSFRENSLELAEVLKDRITRENTGELQEVFDKDYARTLELVERYPDDEYGTDWNKYIADHYQDIPSRDGSVVLRHARIYDLVPNASMTHAIYSFQLSSLQRDSLIDLHTLKIISLNIGSLGKGPDTPFKWSPDGRLLAVAIKEDVTGPEHTIAVLDVQRNEVVFSRTFERYLDYALAWSPDSHSLALVTKKTRMGIGPLELLAAFAGHAVPHNT